MKRISRVKKELLVLSALRRNARMSFLEISKNTGLTVSTLIKSVHELSGELIKKYSCIVNFSKLGFKFNVVFLIKAKKENRAELLKLLDETNVNNAYRINDNFDYYIEAIFHDANSYDDFKRALKDCSYDFLEFFVVEEIIKEGFLEKGIPLEK
ncbi:MAG: Lrp/AsnC family transcriptional regulator [Candidatus Woesearchaeota archaeon]